MKNIISFTLGVILTLIFIFQSPNHLDDKVAQLEKQIKDKQVLIDSSKAVIKEMSRQQDSIRIVRDTILKPIYAKIEEAEHYEEDTSKQIILARFKSFNRTLNFILNADATEIKYHSLQEIYLRDSVKLEASYFVNEVQGMQLTLKDEIILNERKANDLKLRQARSNSIKFALGGVVVGGAAVLILTK